jgi:hypothetical protein
MKLAFQHPYSGRRIPRKERDDGTFNKQPRGPGLCCLSSSCDLNRGLNIERRCLYRSWTTVALWRNVSYVISFLLYESMSFFFRLIRMPFLPEVKESVLRNR